MSGTIGSASQSGELLADRKRAASYSPDGAIRDLGLTQAELDFLAELSPGHAGKVLTGRKEPRFTTIARLCRALDLKIVLVPAVDAPSIDPEAHPEGR
jgi:Helix-turn-helix domain